MALRSAANPLNRPRLTKLGKRSGLLYFRSRFLILMVALRLPWQGEARLYYGSAVPFFFS